MLFGARLRLLDVNVVRFEARLRVYGMAEAGPRNAPIIFVDENKVSKHVASAEWDLPNTAETDEFIAF